VAAIFAIVWLAVAAVTRISSLSAIVATVAVPIGAWILGYDQVAVASALMAVIILIKHRGNIRRLLAGEEPRIGAKA
jgi:glycerol-3-phosphate acyltransferase PlsY